MTEFILVHLGWIIVLEIAAVGALVFGFMHQERFAAFERRIGVTVRRRLRRFFFRVKAVLYIFGRRTFLLFWVPYRRMKKSLLKRLLCQFGLRAVKIPKEQVTGNEILSR